MKTVLNYCLKASKYSYVMSWHMKDPRDWRVDMWTDKQYQKSCMTGSNHKKCTST